MAELQEYTENKHMKREVVGSRLRWTGHIQRMNGEILTKEKRVAEEEEDWEKNSGRARQM